MSIDLTAITPETICINLAEFYSGRDWHKLSCIGQKTVNDLEKIGYITPNKPANGFVGKAQNMDLNQNNQG